MPLLSPRDEKFIHFLVNRTVGGFIQWETTAEDGLFFTSLKGKYRAVLRKTLGSAHPYCSFSLFDDSEREVLNINQFEMADVEELYNAAQRNAFNIDKAIDDIMDDDDEEIPL